MSTRIVVADDHHLVRTALVSLLGSVPDIEICAEAATGNEALSKVKMHKPDILLLDLRMPGKDGFEVLAQLQREKFPVKIMVLTGYGSHENIIRSLELGACACLLKEGSNAELLSAVEAVLTDGFYFSGCTSLELLKEVLNRKKFIPHYGGETNMLDDQQREVVYYHCLQYTAEETAELMHLGKKRVEEIKTEIMEKLNVKNFMGAVIYAHQKGLVDLNSIPLRKRKQAA